MDTALDLPKPTKTKHRRVVHLLLGLMSGGGAMCLGAVISFTGIGAIIGIPMMFASLYFPIHYFLCQSGACPHCRDIKFLRKGETHTGCKKCHNALHWDGEMLHPLGPCPNCGHPPSNGSSKDVIKCRSCKHKLTLKDGVLQDVT